MKRDGTRRPDDLWAITCYFNPLRYGRRLTNYQLFRDRLGVPLVTVELAYGPGFDLRRDDAEILVQLRGRDILWQKERLLNVALEALPDSCSKVAAVDCDVIFAAGDWGEAVGRLLDDVALVQPFARLHHLPPEWRAALPEPAVESTQPSLVAALAAGAPVRASLGRATQREHGVACMGLAWAARRELLDAHGYYDACIVGGGDTALACAAYGCFEIPAQLHFMTARQEERYLAWAEPFHAAVCATSFVDCDAFHLWHGAIGDRRPRQRHAGLARFEFDPFEDIAIAASGCWRWNTDKPGLHEYVADYFASRREDGFVPAPGRLATEAAGSH